MAGRKRNKKQRATLRRKKEQYQKECYERHLYNFAKKTANVLMQGSPYLRKTA